ncbi:hypothetical protein [Acinetobacter modestus]|uniref:hypothetical protein n=1 Tax=Acinetobacter modestus TaxID=1776740 RepID=UPI001F4A7A25|nr:hypothetical protein [Acinetobacter modestus]MCH7331363.1 hypothetical protein [Acinetobacter modestus]
MDKLTIQTDTTVLKINTQSIVVSPVNSVNGKTGVVVLSAEDVGADSLGSAQAVQEQVDALSAEVEQKASTDDLNQVLTLAQTNELKIGTKADQIYLETTQEQVEENRLSILTKADIQALALLAQLVDTKADQAYVNQQIADLVGTAPEALNTIYELAAAIQNEQGLIDSLNQSVANRVRFDIATQALTEIQKQNARTNIDAEKVGTAQQLVSQITASSIGAATAAQGLKANTALQSADVAPVALTGLFTSLASQNKIFDVIFNNYVLGSNAEITASDTLGQMLAKLQAQIKSFSGGTVTWVDITTISGTTLYTGLNLTNTKIELAKINGFLWLRGFYTSGTGGVTTTGEIFRITASTWFVNTSTYTFVSNPVVSVMTLPVSASVNQHKLQQITFPYTGMSFFTGTSVSPSTTVLIPPICVGMAV